jgi:WhiB family redox-sensing transcriptional regulator
MLLVSYSTGQPVAPTTISPIADHWEWQYQGACKNKDTEMFFLEHGERAKTKRKKEQRAIAVCRTCPVIQKCLEHALKVPELYGVWGGTTADQRFVMLKSKKPHYKK